MIAFSELGKMGRLGNQMFQYAFLRSCALRLGVKFYCPRWIGDEIFDLQDEGIREMTLCQPLPRWCPPPGSFGWIEGWEPIDGVDYCGFFQSARYFFSDEDVRSWFKFRSDIMSDALGSFGSNTSKEAVAIHFRFGDYRFDEKFYNPRVAYYRQALKILAGCAEKILVFSDEPSRAQRQLAALNASFHFVTGNSPAVDLAMMASCRAVVSSASTFSWWGAFLCGGGVVCPRQGMFRPGTAWRHEELWPAGWRELDAGLRWYDTVMFEKIRIPIRRVIRRLVKWRV